MKRSGRYRLPDMELISHGDERCGIGNTVNGAVIALYTDRW